MNFNYSRQHGTAHGTITATQTALTRRYAALLLGSAALNHAAPRPHYEDKSDLLHYLDARGRRRPVRSLSDWRKRRTHILEGIEMVMGPRPARAGQPPTETVEEYDESGLLRRKIRYEAEPGDFVPAWLFLPKVPAPHGRAAVCLHQTVRIGKDEPAGLGGKPNLRYARELAERGWVTIAPDYPNFGEYKIDVYAKGYQSASMKGIVNHMRAVDVLLTLPRVNRRRIAACGHSLGGHNTLFLAAFDTRVRAAVTSCGFTSFSRYYGGDLTGWSHKGYMPRIAGVYGKSPERMPFDFHEILGLIAPRAVFVNAPAGDANFDVTGVKDCVRSARTVYGTIYRKPELLAVEHPEAGHDFPAEVRRRAYDFLDRSLG
jgi:dienelactone hydrolase